MSKKSCFRGPFDRQRNKWVETLLQSQGQSLYPDLLTTFPLEKVPFGDIQNRKTVY